MKRLLIIFALLVMPLVAVNAQDNRNRATSTIVSDALAQMPAETPAVYNQVMAELASTGAEGIEQLMDMLDSPDVEKLMQTYNSTEGDAYFITSGTLHAIGAGNLILEK